MIHSDSFVGAVLPFRGGSRGGRSGFDVRRDVAFGKFRRMAKTLQGLAGLVAVHVVVSDSGLASYSAEDRQRRPVLLYGHLMYQYLESAPGPGEERDCLQG